MGRLSRLLVITAACTAGLWWLGRAALPAPPLLHPAAAAAWWRGQGPAVAAFSLIRVVLMGAGGMTTWLLALSLGARLFITAGLEGVDRYRPATTAGRPRWGWPACCCSGCAGPSRS